MLGFVLPATLYLKTHEVAVREAYRLSKSAYYKRTDLTSGGVSQSIESAHSVGSCNIHLHSTVHSEDVVVNPIKNLWPTDRDPSPVQHDEETTITFAHVEADNAAYVEAQVDDTKDGEINMSNTSTSPHERKYTCNLVENSTLWRVIIPFRQFWLPFFMIFFGFVSLIVGVMTVFRDSS